MTTQNKRKQRTWSAFGEVRRKPTEYEIVTHGANWTTRKGRRAPLEQNPSSPQNLWIRSYRDGSPLTVEDWDGFRDPDKMTYRQYVTAQDEAETKVQGVLDQYDEAQATANLDPAWVSDVMLRLYTPQRFPLHGAQQITAYIGQMAPSTYITNVAVLSAADFLRRGSLVAYRTAELSNAFGEAGFISTERSLFENDPAWQPLREAIERILVTYDWAEAFAAFNLVLMPTIDDVLLRQTAELAKSRGDELTWMLNALTALDATRRERWSAALATFAISENEANRDVLARWIDVWSPIADAAAEGLASILVDSSPEHRDASSRLRAAQQARQKFLASAGLSVDDSAAAV